MNDTLYAPVLEHVMVTKDVYDSIFSFVESHSDYRTYIPDVEFVDYNASFNLMSQFIEDAVSAINQNNYSNNDISIATQKFIAETADLWPKQPIYHNRILKFMESAYMIPEKAKNLRNSLVAENPNLSDAITYMTRKYLESYMEHITQELDYINSYINGNPLIPIQESFTYDFHGYYMPEALGSQIAAIPGMILALIKKLMNGLSLSLSEASKKFASRILVDNQINEEAIQQIYKLYQAKARANAQSPIRYPDPQQVHQLRQSYAAGFKAFSDQMVNAINSEDFKSVDQGVTKMVSNFHVVTSNKTLPISASYQEFRTAILSIANNILLMDDFMKALLTIDDAIAQKYGADPKAIKKSLGVKLDEQTQINKMAAQNASVDEDALFDTMFEVRAQVKHNSGIKNDHPQSQQPDPKEAVRTENKKNWEQTKHNFKTAPMRGLATFSGNGLDTVINNFLIRISELLVSDRIVDMIANMISGSMNESVHYMFEAEVDPQQKSNNQQSSTQNQTVQNDSSKIPDFTDLAINGDGEVNNKIFSLDFLTNIISKFKLGGILEKGKQLILDLVENYIRNNGQSFDKNAQTQQQNKNQPKQSQQNQPNQQQPQNASYYYTSADDYFTEENLVSKTVNAAKGLWTFVEITTNGISIAKNVNTILSSNTDNWRGNMLKAIQSVCGRFNLLAALGKIDTYVKMQMDGKDGVSAFKNDKELHKVLYTIATVATGVVGVVIFQMIVNKNPIEAFKGTVRNITSNKVPQPKRASENIANTRQAVPDIVTKLWNSMDNPVKNLYLFVNGWLYGGQQIKGSKEKTVGIAEIIRQEIQSLAPYVNLTDVIQFDTNQKL